MTIRYWLLALAMLAGSVFVGAVASMFSEEAATRLGALPRVIIRCAGLWLPPAIRADRVDEWLAEHTFIERQTVGLPVTRMIRGLRYAVSVVRGVPLVARAVGASYPPSALAASVQRVGGMVLAAALVGAWLMLSLVIPLLAAGVLAYGGGVNLAHAVGRRTLPPWPPTTEEHYYSRWDDSDDDFAWWVAVVLVAPGIAIWTGVLLFDWYALRARLLIGVPVVVVAIFIATALRYLARARRALHRAWAHYGAQPPSS